MHYNFFIYQSNLLIDIWYFVFAYIHHMCVAEVMQKMFDVFVLIFVIVIWNSVVELTFQWIKKTKSRIETKMKAILTYLKMYHLISNGSSYILYVTTLFLYYLICLWFPKRNVRFLYWWSSLVHHFLHICLQNIINKNQ